MAERRRESDRKSAWPCDREAARVTSGFAWSPADLADGVESALRRRALGADREQSVRGIDSLDEVALHPVLASGLRRAGWGVAREVRYPTFRRKRRESEGDRCDLVLTPEGASLLPTERRATLFDPPNAVEPAAAFWLEIKVVAQFTEEGANARWSPCLLSTVQDVVKLSRDESIRHAGLLLVLFVADAAVADHDLSIWQDRCLARTLPIGTPCRRTFAITDRLGNAACSVALYPVMPLVGGLST